MTFLRVSNWLDILRTVTSEDPLDRCISAPTEKTQDIIGYSKKPSMHLCCSLQTALQCLLNAANDLETRDQPLTTVKFP